jgi:signal transduction histidine kinase
MDWEIKRDGIKLRVNTGSQPIPISGDEVMLQQVFVNLIRNAIDAMNESPRAERILHIDILIDDQEAEVTIVDAGCGISADAETNLFVPFVSSKPNGMGVGLNICRSFIELHQGRLWLSSNENCGCTSHVMLPLTPKPGSDNA